jgi:hypothetical protein
MPNSEAEVGERNEDESNDSQPADQCRLRERLRCCMQILAISQYASQRCDSGLQPLCSLHERTELVAHEGEINRTVLLVGQSGES